MSEKVNLTVICPVYNEGKYISQCLDSLLSQDYPKNEMEFLFVDGMSTDNTREIIAEYQKDYPFIKLIENPFRTAPFAMNKGIQNAMGNIIMRIDAHATYDMKYVSTLVSLLSELKADNIGCEMYTDVLYKTSESLAIREVLTNKWGVGNSAFRIGIQSIQLVDTVPFGCFPKQTFAKYGLYDTRLDRNQDIELNKRIVRGGGKIYIVPKPYITYYARNNYADLAANNFENGKWNLWTLFYTRNFDSLSIRHFVPFIFVLSLLASFLLGFVYSFFFALFAFILLSYFSFFGYLSYKMSKEKDLEFKCVLMAFATLHFSYGIGSLMGFLLWPFK
ncbi:MAG: glycosyltransferase family 2 protein [Paludibacteraceae bacterium]|nr:glycosyltransferase family 2 protein [Paludibacteraceae bacterium]